MKYLLALFFIINLNFCASRQDKKIDMSSLNQSSFTGYNRYGELGHCIKTKNLKTCKVENKEAENFKKACNNAPQGIAFQCDCHSYLCSENVKKRKERP